MLGIAPVVVTTIVALPVGLISFATVRASQSARRNREDRCGNCAGPLYAPGAPAGPSLVQGHLLCEPCATKGRRSLSSVRTPGSPCSLHSSENPAIFGAAIAWMKERIVAQRTDSVCNRTSRWMPRRSSTPSANC